MDDDDSACWTAVEGQRSLSVMFSTINKKTAFRVQSRSCVVFGNEKKNRLHFTNARVLARVCVCDVLQRVVYVVHGLYVWFYCTGMHHDMRGFNEEATRPAAVVAPGNNITPLVTNHSWTTWRRGYTMLQQPQGQQSQCPGKRTSCRGFRGPPITSRAGIRGGQVGRMPWAFKS